MGQAITHSILKCLYLMETVPITNIKSTRRELDSQGYFDLDLNITKQSNPKMSKMSRETCCCTIIILLFYIILKPGYYATAAENLIYLKCIQTLLAQFQTESIIHSGPL